MMWLDSSYKRTKTESTKKESDSLRLDNKLVVGCYHYTYIDLVFIVPDRLEEIIPKIIHSLWIYLLFPKQPPIILNVTTRIQNTTVLELALKLQQAVVLTYLDHGSKIGARYSLFTQ